MLQFHLNSDVELGDQIMKSLQIGLGFGRRFVYFGRHSGLHHYAIEAGVPGDRVLALLRQVGNFSALTRATIQLLIIYIYIYMYIYAVEVAV